MFTGRRPRAFQFRCCVDTIILGQAIVLRKVKDNRLYGTWMTRESGAKGTFHAKAQRSQDARRVRTFDPPLRLAIFAPLREKPLQLLVRGRVR